MSVYENNIVGLSTIAIKIGEILCEALYGDVAQQRPLSVMDNGNFWRVEGSYNRDGARNEPSDFFMSIQKADGAVTDIGQWWRYQPHPSVVPLIEAHFARETTSRVDLGQIAEHDANSTAREFGPGMLVLTNLARGGVVFSAALAVKIGEVLCDAHYGDLIRQAPMIATDQDKYWRVEGSYNQDRKVEAQGPFFLSIQKYDGRVLEIRE